MTLVFLVARFFWELPQNLLGCLVWLFVRRNITEVTVEHRRLFLHVPNFGISLGSFVFWSNSDNAFIKINPDNKAHEFGHTLQSLRFGPLYLIAVGLPSISRVIYGAIYYAIKREKWQGYYQGYPERWADELGRKHF